MDANTLITAGATVAATALGVVLAYVLKQQSDRVGRIEKRIENITMLDSRLSRVEERQQSQQEHGAEVSRRLEAIESKLIAKLDEVLDRVAALSVEVPRHYVTKEECERKHIQLNRRREPN